MGVYIKGMEMPKNCFDCMFHWHGDGTTYCLAQSKMHDLHHIKWQCKGYEEQMKYREPTCPLVPVPPHRRLIDILDIPDVLRNYFDIGDSYVYNLTRVKEAFAIGTVHLDDFVEWDETDIDELTAYISANTPTIIEAEVTP